MPEGKLYRQNAADSKVLPLRTSQKESAYWDEGSIDIELASCESTPRSVHSYVQTRAVNLASPPSRAGERMFIGFLLLGAGFLEPGRLHEVAISSGALLLLLGCLTRLQLKYRTARGHRHYWRTTRDAQEE